MGRNRRERKFENGKSSSFASLTVNEGRAGTKRYEYLSRGGERAVLFSLVVGIRYPAAIILSILPWYSCLAIIKSMRPVSSRHTL